MNRNFALALMTLFVATTASLSDAAEPKKAPAKAQIDGQVFIVTKGQQAVKLALVQVLATSEDDINKFFTAQANSANATRRELAPTVKELKEKQAEIRKELQPSLMKARELRSEIVDENTKCKALGGMAFVNCMKSPESAARTRNADAFDLSIAPLKEKDRDISAAYRDVKERYDNPVKPLAFLTGLETSIAPLATAKTDADGKFTVAVPAGKRVAILARATRLAAGETEEYRWLLWVPIRKGETKISATLANDNLFDTSCSDCISYLPLIELHQVE